MKSIIHVNKHLISQNTKDGGNRPIYTIKQKGKTLCAREVIINGPSKLVYNGQQLSCGARAWLETTADIEMIDQMTPQEAKQLDE